MPKYALIKYGIVENIIVADSDFVATLTEYDYKKEVSNKNATIGSTYNHTLDSYTAPARTIPVLTKFTRLEFQKRFTFDELVAIESAAETSPGVRVLQRQQLSAEYIDLNDEATQLGVMYLVSVGLLTHARGVEILTP